MLLTKKASIHEEISNLKAVNYIMGQIIIGVEGGYMLMYKKRWEVSKGSLIGGVPLPVPHREVLKGAGLFRKEGRPGGLEAHPCGVL